MQSKKTTSFGQYFTPRFIADFMVELSSTGKEGSILDPSAGEGVFLDSLSSQGFKNIHGYEVDKKLKKTEYQILYKSFLSTRLDETFDVIIGNPPYVRWKNLDKSLKNELEDNKLWIKYCNSLCDYFFIFILTAITLLKENGELVFIVPEYFLTTKHAKPVRDFMLEQGYFEQIIHFNETPLFKDISSSLIIFIYRKTKVKTDSKIRVVKYFNRRKIDKKTLNDFMYDTPQQFTEKFFIDQFSKDRKWLLAKKDVVDEMVRFEKECDTTLGEIADIGNGMVNGLDDAFQVEDMGNFTTQEKEALLGVAKAKDLERFFIKEKSEYLFPQNIPDEKKLKNDYPHFFTLLQPYKARLLKRYNYGRNIPYWHWVFLRNYSLFQKQVPKIFIPCKERISHKSHVRFAVVPKNIFPTQDVTAIILKDGILESIYYVAALLNSQQVFQWIKYNGVLRGNILEFSEAPLNAIPIRQIDWKNKKEVLLHDAVVQLVKRYIAQKDADVLLLIDKKIQLLLSMKHFS